MRSSHCRSYAKKPFCGIKLLYANAAARQCSLLIRLVNIKSGFLDLVDAVLMCHRS